MRVTFLTHCFPGWEGDTKGHVVFAFAGGLAARGIEVSVVSSTVAERGAAAPLRLPDGVRFAPFPVREEERDLKAIASRPFRLLAQMWRFRRAAAREVGRFKPHLIHSFWALPAGVIGASLARRHGIPHIAHCMGSDLRVFAKRNAVTRWLTGRALRGSAAVAGVSRDLLQCAVDDHGVDPARCHHICTGVDSEIFRPIPRERAECELGVSTPRPRALFVGELTAIKGLDTLIEAFGRVRGAGVQGTLHLIGAGDQMDSLRGRVEQMGLGDAVRFEGWQPHGRIPLWMNACDVLVLPSLSEGTPNVVMEALCCGCPVIASRVGGTAEAVGNCRGAALFDAGDADQLQSHLRDALSTPSLSEAAAAGAADFASAHGIESSISLIVSLHRESVREGES
ncbi:glycosyltransferase [Candidatus Sumerlaeota bacterium]|nr:glycosyltransferase [Candidatus Sumerlaeota bacterium]